jgi:hypothetical protein
LENRTFFQLLFLFRGQPYGNIYSTSAWPHAQRRLENLIQRIATHGLGSAQKTRVWHLINREYRLVSWNQVGWNTDHLGWMNKQGEPLLNITMIAPFNVLGTILFAICMALLSLAMLHEAQTLLASVGWHGMASVGWHGMASASWSG